MASRKSSEPSLAIHVQLISLWSRLLEARVNGIDDNFFDLGGRSPDVPGMLREVERMTGKPIAGPAFLERPTIRHLAECLLARARDDGTFVCVQPGRGGLPFYFFHGDILGGGFYSRRLASLLGPEQPFYVSAPIELSEHELPSVEELAARKRHSLQQCQPHGPYLLGGFCVGAVVAYELARQLKAQGEEVRCVVLIEPEIGNALTRSHQKVVNQIAARHKEAREKVDTFMRGLRKIERLRNVWRAPLREKKEFLVQNSRRVLARSSRPSPEPAPASNGRSEGHGRDWLIAAYHWVLTSYVPRRYPGRTMLFLTDEHLEQTPFILKQWRKVAPQTRVERIPGKHLSCITTHLTEIARKIRAEIESVKSFVGMLLPAFGSHAWMFEI